MVTNKVRLVIGCLDALSVYIAKDQVEWLLLHLLSTCTDWFSSADLLNFLPYIGGNKFFSFSLFFLLKKKKVVSPSKCWKFNFYFKILKMKPYLIL